MSDIHPDVSAWYNWKQKAQGCFEGSPSGTYLENRLWAAFVAGREGMHPFVKVPEALGAPYNLKQESLESWKPYIMNGIGWAIKQMHNGSRVTRTGWNGKNMWLALQVPDEHSKMTQPYIYMKTANNTLVPWLASQTDLLATDWDIVS